MTPASLLAFAAAAVGVLGAWELLAAVERTRVVAGLERLLAPLVRAGLEGRAPTVRERRRLGLLAAGVLAAGGWIVGGAIVAGMAALAGPGVTVALVRARRRRFSDELRRAAAPVARALSDALGAGHSVTGAIAVAAAAVPGAAGHELRSAVRALGLGETLGAVLERLRRRAACGAWDAIVAGILLQRDAGGDLAGLLRELAAGLEATARQERDARVATAQARFTARLVALLPVCAAVLAELASPGFVAGLLTDPLSATLAALAVALELTALAAVRLIARR